VNIVDSQNGTILTPLWFRYLGSRSGLRCCRGLDFAGRLVGMSQCRRHCAKNLSPNIRAYTPAQAKKYLRIIEGVMSGESGTSN